MNKVVSIAAVLFQVVLAGCGNKDKNAGVPPQACGAGVPSQYCLPVQNPNGVYGVNPSYGAQGYGYYMSRNFFVPSYQNVQTGCTSGNQPISDGSNLNCMPTSTFQQYGQPVYQQNYQWSQNQPPSNANGPITPGPAVACSDSSPCQTGFCQPLQSAPAAGYCRAS